MKVEEIQRIQHLPNHIEEEIEERKAEEFYDAFLYKNTLYLIANLGQKCTGGYQVNIGEIVEASMEKWEVMMNKKEPIKEKLVAQAISFPRSIVKVLLNKEGKFPERIAFKNGKGEVIQLTSVKEESRV